jgi:GTP-binding protein HflX
MSQDNIFEDHDEIINEEWQDLEAGETTAFIGMVIRPTHDPQEARASLEEMQRLADTADIKVLDILSQNRKHPDNSLYFGKGFLEELVQNMKEAGCELLIINDELSPSQARNIEKEHDIEVIDRTEVILTIFHRHAKTKEAKLQVKLAELKYQLPRLKRLWTHLDQERGTARAMGGAASRGMGEKQLEIDKRLIREQIRKIDKAIDRISAIKETQRKSRDKTKTICIVGYTNAGKSTLFNRLTDAGVLVQDQLFATLDSTSRQLKLSAGEPVILSDTVGFIADLPHHLVASFRATLMEAVDADLLIHLVDISDDRHEFYIEQVNMVLQSIGAGEIPQLLVLNKADLLDAVHLKLVNKYYKGSVAISAITGENIDELLVMMEEKLYSNMVYKLKLPYEQTSMVSRMHDLGKITQEDYLEDGIYLEVTLPQMYSHLIKDFIKED